MGTTEIQAVDKIDTTNFPQAIKAIEKMAKSMRDLVDSVADYKTAILKNWVGDGRNQFEKTYTYVHRKLNDGCESTWDVYENLLSAEERLIQNDVDVANGIKVYKNV